MTKNHTTTEAVAQKGKNVWLVLADQMGVPDRKSRTAAKQLIYNPGRGMYRVLVGNSELAIHVETFDFQKAIKDYNDLVVGKWG